MNTHFCDIGVRLLSELRGYGNRFMDDLTPRINDSFYLAPTCKVVVVILFPTEYKQWRTA